MNATTPDFDHITELLAACFDAQGRRIWIPRIDRLTVPCDLCGALLHPERFALLQVNAHTSARVNLTRHWGFCSDAHRVTWWAEDAAAFWPCVPLDRADSESDRWIHPEDGAVQINVIHVAGPRLGDQIRELRAGDGRLLHRSTGKVVLAAHFEDGHALNRWWSTADRLDVMPADGEILWRARAA